MTINGKRIVWPMSPAVLDLEKQEIAYWQKKGRTRKLFGIQGDALIKGSSTSLLYFRPQKQTQTRSGRLKPTPSRLKHTLQEVATPQDSISQGWLWVDQLLELALHGLRIPEIAQRLHTSPENVVAWLRLLNGQPTAKPQAVGPFTYIPQTTLEKMRGKSIRETHHQQNNGHVKREPCHALLQNTLANDGVGNSSI